MASQDEIYAKLRAEFVKWYEQGHRSDADTAIALCTLFTMFDDMYWRGQQPDEFSAKEAAKRGVCLINPGQPN